MRMVKIPNFVSKEEAAELVEFYESQMTSSRSFSIDLYGNIAQMGKQVAETNIISVIDTIPLVHTIKDRIESTYDLSAYRTETKNGVEGIFSLILPEGGEMYQHVDSRDSVVSIEDEVMRFNVLLQKPVSGGILFTRNNYGQYKEHDVGIGELHTYNVTETYHGVTKVLGPVPRIMLLFSYVAPKGTSDVIQPRVEHVELSY